MREQRRSQLAATPTPTLLCLDYAKGCISGFTPHCKRERAKRFPCISPGSLPCVKVIAAARVAKIELDR